MFSLGILLNAVKFIREKQAKQEHLYEYASLTNSIREKAVHVQNRKVNSNGVVISETIFKIDLNQASRAELEAIPSIGPVLAQRILDFRECNGDFKKVDDIINIKGIGQKKLLRIKKYLKVSNNTNSRRRENGKG